MSLRIKATGDQTVFAGKTHAREWLYKIYNEF